MTTFDKREEGFEKQFAVDEELRFKATARRNKLLGLWAAQKLGLSGTEAEEYAKAVVLEVLDQSSRFRSFVEDLALAFIDSATAAHRRVPWFVHLDAVAPVEALDPR